MKTICIFLGFLLVFGIPDGHSQTRKKRKAVPQKADSEQPPVISVAPPKGPLYETPLIVRRDTSGRDTTGIGGVVNLVHDSIKAQIKAPIIQVPVTLRSLIIPGALFAYGALTLNNTGLRVINQESKELFWSGKKAERPYIEDYLLLVPAAAVYGLNIAGIKGQNNLVDRSIIYGMSNLIANGFGFGLKSFGLQTRPDSSDNFAFISGHTAEAFVSAEFLHQEYRGRIHWSVIAGGYACAVSVAYLRMYHNKHWLSDVVAGAGVGIASTRFSYYLYPILKHVLFGSKKVRQNAMIMPTYRSGGGYGLAFSLKF